MPATPTVDDALLLPVINACDEASCCDCDCGPDCPPDCC